MPRADDTGSEKRLWRLALSAMNREGFFSSTFAVGKLTKVADSEAQFRELVKSKERREEWFAEADEQACAGRGLKPSATQCIGFSVPLVFAESGSPDTPYVADLYELISSNKPRGGDAQNFGHSC
jgi:hypothetical protein